MLKEIGQNLFIQFIAVNIFEERVRIGSNSQCLRGEAEQAEGAAT